MENSIRSDKKDSNRELLAGLILPCLNPLYRSILDPLFRYFKIVDTMEFWIYLSFGIFATVLYATGASVWVPILFLIGAIAVLIVENNTFFRNLIFPKDSDKIKDFLDRINSKTIDEILMFIQRYQLNTEQIIQVIEHKPGTYDIYLFINKNQSIKSELLEYLIINKAYVPMGEDLFCKFLMRSLDHISKENYDLLKKIINTKKCVKTINTCYPFYLQDHSIFKAFAHAVIYIKNALNYGPVKWGIFSLSLAITIVIIQKYRILIQVTTNSKMEILSQIMGNLFIWFMIACILSLGVWFIIIRIFRLFRYVIYSCAPSK